MGTANSNSKANPRVSVIIPTYDRAHLVGRAIQSVLDQTYQDFEVIVIDDGSTDNTAEVVDSYGDERVKYIRHQVNKGTPAAARNTGIKAAMGELIGFVDSDDEWLPEKLQRQVDKFDSSSENVALIYGGYEAIDDETKKSIGLVRAMKRGYMFTEMLKMSGPVNILTPLVKRECFERVGLFDEDMRFAEDWDMWLRIAEHYEFDFVEGIVARSYLSREQLRSDRIGALEGLSKFRAKHWQHLSARPAILAHQLNWVGQAYLVAHEYARARRYFAQAVRANPRGLRLYFDLLAAYVAPNLYRAMLKTIGVLRFREYFARVRKLARIR